MAQVFVSYSHQDEPWKDRTIKHLKVFAGAGLEVWDDRRIDAGADWKAAIDQAIADSDVALLLVSADFLTSRFILGQEVPPLLERRQAQGVRVIPVILAPCAWDRIPWLCAIQARPRDGKPLSGMSRHAAEAALAALAREVADLLLAPLSGPAQAGFDREIEQRLADLEVRLEAAADPRLTKEVRRDIADAGADLSFAPARPRYLLELVIRDLYRRERPGAEPKPLFDTIDDLCAGQ